MAIDLILSPDPYSRDPLEQARRDKKLRSRVLRNKLTGRDLKRIEQAIKELMAKCASQSAA